MKIQNVFIPSAFCRYSFTKSSLFSHQAAIKPKTQKKQKEQAVFTYKHHGYFRFPLSNTIKTPYFRYFTLNRFPFRELTMWHLNFILFKSCKTFSLKGESHYSSNDILRYKNLTKSLSFPELQSANAGELSVLVSHCLKFYYYFNFQTQPTGNER